MKSFALALVLITTAQPAVSALPRLALEADPPAARSAISAAYAAADGKAAGDLGRVLHAWEQWDAARGAKGRHDAAIVERATLTEPRDAEAPRYLFALATAHIHAGHRDEAVKWATEAKALAETFGDTALAAAIERDLARIR